MTTESGVRHGAGSAALALVRWLPAAIVAGLAALLFASTVAGMAVAWWTEPAWSQGMLLPPLAAYMAWIHRDRTLALPARVEFRGMAGIALACLGLLAGRLVSEFFLMRISFVVLLAGLTWTFWGAARLRTLAFPFLLLVAMVPLPAVFFNSLAAPLQLLASDWAVGIAQFAGISIFRDGNVIQLAGATLGVAEACSGLSSLSAMVVGSIILGYMLCASAWCRFALVVMAPPLAILLNILRIAGTAILAEYGQELAFGYYHLFSGWLVVMAGFGLIYLAARGLQTGFGRQVPAL